MRAGRLLHATRDAVPEGLAGSGRWYVRTRCRRVSPCLLCCRDLFAPLGAQAGTSNAAHTVRLTGAEFIWRYLWAGDSLRPDRRAAPGVSAPLIIDSWCGGNPTRRVASAQVAKALE